MKNKFFKLIPELSVALGMFFLGVAVGHFVEHYTYNKKIDTSVNVQDKCHVVNHTSSDGYSFWSCEKNR